jgi:pilus assembly protein CpaB
MRFRSLIMLTLALTSAASASFGVYQFTSIKPTKVMLEPETESVVVLTVDVTRVGTVLTQDMVKLAPRPKGLLHEDVLRDINAVIGQSVVMPLFRGEAILPAKLGKGSGLAALVPEGMVAFTFQAPSESSLMAGFAMPNDRVDILLTRNDPSKQRGGKVTQRLVQNVRILAAGEEINRPAGNRVERVRNVTLAVPPGTDQKLAMAQEVGTLALVLRSAPDNQNHANNPIYLADLEGAEELALIDKVNSSLGFMASTARSVGSVVRDFTDAALDQEVKRLTSELAMRTRELEEARAAAQLTGSSNHAATAVLTIRGSSQSYVTVKPIPQNEN